jgi:Reverse transcriptase (RNA-dependent DNA polymerase)
MDQTTRFWKLKNNLYQQKQAGRVWNLYLVENLIKMGFQQSQHEPCILWRGSTIIVVYTNNTIVTSPDETEIDQVMKDIGSRFESTTKESVDKFLGVKIERDDVHGTIKLTQPQLIDAIISDLNLDNKSNQRRLPALASKVLHRHIGSESHSEDWHYRSAIGKLN